MGKRFQYIPFERLQALVIPSKELKLKAGANVALLGETRWEAKAGKFT